jgi:hypothetical protein
VDIVGSRIKCRANKASFLLTEVCLRHSLLWVGSGLSLSKFLEPSITLEQRSVRWLLQKSCGFENQRVAPYFLSIPEFAYTFAYTPTLTTRRAPVYNGLSWVSALITREPKQDLKLTKSQLLRQKVWFGHLSVTLSNGKGAKKCVGNYYTVYRVAIPIDYGLMGCLRPTGDFHWLRCHLLFLI